MANRALTPEEARAEYLRRGYMGVEVEVLDRYLFVGRAGPCRLVLENRAPTDITVNPRYEIRGESGARVDEGALPAVIIRAGQSQRLVVAPTLPAVGPYVLTISFGHEGRMVTRSIDLLGLAEKEFGQSGQGQLSTVMTVNAISPPAMTESEPFDLRVFRADPVHGVVSGGRAVVPDAFVRELERQMGVVEQRLAIRHAKGEDLAVEAAHLQRARQWREGREFARLYRGLQEDWATDEAENLVNGSKVRQERAKSKAKN